jgi:hypothetical protein
MPTKPWHLHSHDEKLEEFAAACRWCGKQYVNHTALWVHEHSKCSKRTDSTERQKEAK